MKIDLHQIDAFADRLFAGNPAAVCPLADWLSDELMQSIASENNLSETAFVVKEGEDFRIRWFTPVAEVKLCGHATLASAYVLFELIGVSGDFVRFQSLSGLLTVGREGDGSLTMNFPRVAMEERPVPGGLSRALGAEPLVWLQGEDGMAVFEREEDVTSLKPDFGALASLPFRGVIVTAPGKECDFVSRFFAPAHGIDEDPVTGSAHCALAPYWSKRLGQDCLEGIQRSKREGRVRCRVDGERVFLTGTARHFLSGSIHLA